MNKNKYKFQVFKDIKDYWACEIYKNNEALACYGSIHTEDDAITVGEAFIDGIRTIEGE